MGNKGGWHRHPGEALRVGAGFALADLDPSATPGWKGDRGDAVKEMAHRGGSLAILQERLFASAKNGDTRSVLLVLQGMDTAGKGGVVSHVVGQVNPQGVAIRSFGVPTEEERRHHYLWRIRGALPTAGRIGVFDRSHFEQVLVVRVHNLVPRQEWETYYDELNAFETEVAAAGTTIIKCALVISPEEQLSRLGARLEDESKYWKYNPRDLDERGLWNEYQAAYQAMFDRCSPASVPWHAVPADHKWYARLAITEILATALEDLDLSWPPATFDVAVEEARIADLDPGLPEVAVPDVTAPDAPRSR